MNTKFWKGLFQTLFGAIAAYIVVTPVDWNIILITGGGAIISYLIQRSIKNLRSKSIAKDLDTINFFAGGFIASLNAIISGVATFVVNGKINWPLLGGAALSTFIAYISGTYVEGQKK